MNKRKDTYFIKGYSYDRDGLLLYAEKKCSSPETPEWEKEIWHFITEWFSPEDYLEVTTSGSTGKPKKIRLAKKQARASARMTLDFFGLKPGDTALLCLPVKYIAGKMMIVRALTGSLNLFFTGPFSVPRLEDFGIINFAAMIPMQVANLFADDEGRKQLEEISTLIIGGSPIPASLEKELKTTGNNIWQTYGMTETISHIALRRLNGPEASLWYEPLPGVQLKTDERGCLVITAPYIGVQNLVTNDLVIFNDKGSFRIRGRIDHVVISGGIKLFPEEIEQKLAGVVESEYFMAGLPDKKLGEKLVLFVEGLPENQEQEKTLWRLVKNILSGYEVPKEIIYFKTFRRSANGKVLRQATLQQI